MIRKITIVLLTFVAVFSCTKKSAPVVPADRCLVNGVDTCKKKVPLTASIDLGSEKQTIHSFGASDCWGIKFIGKNWPLEKRNQIADLLFSKDFDANGNPKGIGLSMWRMNIGAGSFEQGTNSKISSEWRREESYIDAAGNYDFSKQSGGKWFANAAKLRNVENMLLFSISAPVSMTKNGLAFGSSDAAELGKLNLKSDKYAAFADFLAEVTKHYNQSGLPINYISPLNEPQWNWIAGGNGEASQEGTSATNAEAFEVVKELNTKLNQKGIATKIAFGEAASHNFVFGPVANTADRSDVFNYFWNPSASKYIGSFSNVEKLISSHSYFAQNNVASLISNRVNLANRINSINPSVKLWQSEYCILGGEDNIAGNGRDLGMNAALYIARVIHTDLAIANASSWQWWLAVSPSDYKDGLVYVTDVNGNMGELPATKNDGLVYQSKMLWALGNYSRFIRPGMIRVNASLQNYTDPTVAANGVMISAYKKPTTKQAVIVIVNISGEDKEVKLQGISFSGATINAYSTSAFDNLTVSQKPVDAAITIAAKSIVTLTGTYQ